MKKKLNIITNQEGFTLVELLAVIVILAVLMLMATPAVINIMNNSRQNSFKTEALSFIDAAKTKYTTDSMANVSSSSKCYTIADLAEYVDKDLSNYEGTVNIKYDADDGTTEYSISISNGTYKTAGTETGYDSWSVVDDDSSDITVVTSCS